VGVRAVTPPESKYWVDFTYWIEEREQIRIKKEDLKTPPPWTKDRIMATTRFCNIRREDDKVTRWIRQNWSDPNFDHPNLAFSMCLARIVNWPETLMALGFPDVWSPAQFISRMTELSQGGSRKIWGGAYMVTGGYSAGGETKQLIMSRCLEEAFVHAAEINTSYSCEQAFREITQARGFSTFLGAQVVADLKYTPLLSGSRDRLIFCAPGPGSTMGLNFLHGREPKASITFDRFFQEVNEIRYWLEENLVTLDAHDTQNCLCEFSKYVRIKYLGGRAKNGYKAC